MSDEITRDDFKTEAGKNYFDALTTYDVAVEASRQLSDALNSLDEVYSEIVSLAGDYEEPSERLEGRYIERKEVVDTSFEEYQTSLRELESALESVESPPDEQAHNDFKNAVSVLEEFEGIVQEYIDTFESVITVDESEDEITVDTEGVRSAQSDFSVLQNEYNETVEKIDQFRQSNLWQRVGEAIREHEYNEKSLGQKALTNFKAFFTSYGSQVITDLKVPSIKYKIYTVLQQFGFWLGILSLVMMEFTLAFWMGILWLSMFFFKGFELGKLEQNKGYTHPNK